MYCLKIITSLAAAFLATMSVAFAQNEDPSKYPTKTIRIIVPYGPGGGTDIVARLAAQALTEALGQPTIVENRPGGPGLVGTEAVARAQPDGYTLLVAPSGPLSINPVLRKTLPYSPQNDFAPISVLARLPLLVTVNASLPVKSIKELIEHAKSRPNEITYASSAPLFQLATELFKQKTGTNFLLVPYKSSGESAAAILTNQVTLAIADVPPLVGLVKDGKLRALAYADESRSSEFPDVPTVAEAGLPGTEIATLVGILAPAGTPEAIVKKIHNVMVQMVKKPETRQRFIALGAEPVGSSPKEFADAIVSDIKRWEEVAARANIEKQ